MDKKALSILVFIAVLLVAFPIYAQSSGYISFYFEVRTETDYLGWTEPHLQNFKAQGAVGISPYKDEINVPSGIVRANYRIVIQIDGETVFDNEYWQKGGTTATFKIYRDGYSTGTHSYKLELLHNHGTSFYPNWVLDAKKEGTVEIALAPPPWQIENYVWVIAMIIIGFTISYAVASSTGEKGTATIASLIIVAVIYLIYVTSLTGLPEWWWPPSWFEAMQNYSSYFINNLIWLALAIAASVIGAQLASKPEARKKPTIIVIGKEKREEVKKT